MKATSAAEVIRARRIALNTRQEYVSFFSRLAVMALAVYIIFTEVFLVTQNKGLGMFPAMKDGDLIIAYRLQQDYAKNDVVVYEVNGEQKVGRIVARETDVVTLDDSGTLLVNGTVQNGEILYPTYMKDGINYPYEISEGQVFIMGDYRTNTVDSRDYGAISIRNVKAKVITIIRRRGL